MTHKMSGRNIILCCQVRYSQTIGNYHQVEATINRDDNEIVGVKCDCIASEGRCCSHTAGLAFKINEANKKGFIGIACTDLSCSWNRSTQHNVLPDTVQNIRSSSNSSMANTVLAFETDHHLMAHLNQPHMQALSSAQGTILNHMLTARPQPVPISQSDQRATSENISHGSHETPLECTPCKKVFEEYVELTDSQASNLAEKTVNQKSALWTSQRKLRITSSAAASVPKRQDTDPAKWIKNYLDPAFRGNAATAHGQQHEHIAREQFEKETGSHIFQAGLIVRPEESWLGASLDGRIDEDTILEIKCPTPQKMSKHKSLAELFNSRTYDVRTNDKGEYFLRQTAAANGMYMQVQVAMYCAKASKCKFMVWTASEAITVDVPFDQQWFREQFKRLKEFYFANLLPALTDAINSHTLSVVKLP